MQQLPLPGGAGSSRSRLQGRCTGAERCLALAAATRGQGVAAPALRYAHIHAHCDLHTYPHRYGHVDAHSQPYLSSADQ